jgi:hypothetical protein
MSNYTSIFIYPMEKEFIPSEFTSHKIFEFLNCVRINAARGSDHISDDEEEDRNVFFLTDVSLAESLRAMQKHHPGKTHFLLAYEGYLKTFCDSLVNTIPPELANDFVPWRTGMTIGNWRARDYETDDVFATGSFCITKSGNGCPLNLRAYLDAFNENPEVQNMIRFLELETNCKWTTCIQFSG